MALCQLNFIYKIVSGPDLAGEAITCPPVPQTSAAPSRPCTNQPWTVGKCRLRVSEVGLSHCISRQLPGGADAASSWTTLRGKAVRDPCSPKHTQDPCRWQQVTPVDLGGGEIRRPNSLSKDSGAHGAGVYLCFPDTFPTHDGLHAQDSVGNVPPKPQHGFAENLTGSMVSQSHQFRSPRDPCFRS